MIEREFAGEVRSFQLQPPNRSKLYRGVESDVGNLSQLAMQALLKKPVDQSAVIHILSHALSGGHAIGLMRARALVTGEVGKHALAALQPLAIDIIADAYAGAGDGG